jgi:thiol:disulfide interchange protein DsbC
MLKKFTLALCIGGLSVAAATAAVVLAAQTPAASPVTPSTSSAVSPAAAQMVRQALGKLSGKLEVDAIEPAPMPGFYQVIASGRLIYVSADGKYLLDGDLIELGRQKNVSEEAWARFRKAELARVPASERIVFAPAHPKYTVTVFTDVNCGYCRALHEHIAAFNQAGIAVEYLAWPREGVTTTAGRPTATYTEMVSVWCAADRKAAFSDAKQGHTPKPLSCSNPVKDEFELGLKLGVSGTPTIYGPDGRTLGGYVTPDQLLQELREGS